MLFSEECAVTGCASTHSFPFQFLFTWDVEPLSRGTRSDDDTFGIDSVLIIHRDFKRTFIKSDFRNKSISAIGTKTLDRKSTRLNSSHVAISYAVFCLKKKKTHVLTSYTAI